MYKSSRGQKIDLAIGSFGPDSEQTIQNGFFRIIFQFGCSRTRSDSDRTEYCSDSPNTDSASVRILVVWITSDSDTFRIETIRIESFWIFFGFRPFGPSHFGFGSDKNSSESSDQFRFGYYSEGVNSGSVQINLNLNIIQIGSFWIRVWFGSGPSWSFLRRWP